MAWVWVKLLSVYGYWASHTWPQPGLLLVLRLQRARFGTNTWNVLPTWKEINSIAVYNHTDLLPKESIRKGSNDLKKWRFNHHWWSHQFPKSGMKNKTHYWNWMNTVKEKRSFFLPLLLSITACVIYKHMIELFFPREAGIQSCTVGYLFYNRDIFKKLENDLKKIMADKIVQDNGLTIQIR